MKDLKGISLVLIFVLLSGMTPVQSFNTSISENDLGYYDSTQLEKSDSILEKTIDSGFHLVHDELIEPSMIIHNDLLTIPYKIVEITTPIRYSAGIFPNSKMAFDTSYSDSSELHSEDIFVHDVWDQGYNGTGIVIAIIDTGIDFSHPALDGKKVDEASFHRVEYGFSEDRDAMDTNGHGTAVASVAAGWDTNFKGTAFGAGLVNARIGLESGFSSTLSVVAAFDWVISHPEVDIISMSLSEIEEGYSFDPLEEIVNQGVQAGKIVFSSAGNTGKTSSNKYQLGSPSTAPEAISIGATDGNGNPIYFSSEGPNYSNEAKPDLVASGNDVPIALLNGGTGSADGTSFSTPIVTGIAANLLQASRKNDIVLSPGELKAVLANGTIDIGANHYTQGFGLVNGSKSLDLILNQNINPIIGPSIFLNDQIPYTIPVNSKVTIPISMIGFPTDIFEISTNINGITVNHDIRYSGDTSILHLDIIIDSLLNLTSIDLNIQYNDQESTSHNISYELNVDIIPEPEYTVLLDLKHTIYDTIYSSPKFERLERIDGDDIRYLQNKIISDGGWITELIYDNFTLETLTEYDVLWISSGFSTPVDSLYDHEYQLTNLLTEEAFIIHDYLQQGGALMLDFDGESDYDSWFEINHDPMSLNMISSVLGIEAIEDPDEANQTDVTSSTLLIDGFTQVAKGTVKLSNGIITAGDNFGGSGLAKFIGNGRAFVHNSRDWRIEHGNIPVSDNYVDNILNFIRSQNQNITDYSLNNDGIHIEVREGSYLDTIIDDIIANPAYVEINANGVSETDYSIEYVQNTLSILFDSRSGDKIQFNLNINSTNLLQIIQTLEEEPPAIINFEIDNTHSNVRFLFELSNTNFLASNTRLFVDNYYNFNGFMINGELTFNVDPSESLESSLNSSYLELIDDFGRLYKFNLNDIHDGTPTINPSSVSENDSTNDTNVTEVSGFLVLLLLSSAMIVKRRRL